MAGGLTGLKGLTLWKYSFFFPVLQLVMRGLILLSCLNAKYEATANSQLAYGEPAMVTKLTLLSIGGYVPDSFYGPGAATSWRYNVLIGSYIWTSLGR